MIEDGQATVIVAFDDKAKDAVEKLSVEAISSGVLARRLQSYIVQLRPEDRNLLMENGHAAFAAPRLRGEQFAVLRTDALYCGDTGLLWENGDYLATERLFF